MLQIVRTADGSNTIFNSLVGENYHSKHGALQESRHVFVRSGLEYFLDKSTKTEDKIKVSPTAGDLEGAHTVSILEVGFGTGLNFLLSADVCAERGVALDYTGIESDPLSQEMISQTGYREYVSELTWESFINNYQQLLQPPVEVNTSCKLQIAHCKLLNFQSARQYDIIYFDAFASAYQPEMWDDAAIAHTLQFLKPWGIFVTYAITGNLKRAIKALGCKVEKAPGAPGKREMLRAVKMA